MDSIEKLQQFIGFYSPVPTFVIDTSHVVRFANKAFHDILSLPDGEVISKNLWEIWSQDKYADLKLAYDRALSSGRDSKVEYEFIEMGTWTELLLTPRDGFLIVTCVDITEHKRNLSELYSQMTATQSIIHELAIAGERASSDASTDQLTGLPNRRRAKDLADSVFPALAERRIPVSVIVMDVDHFKNFNDTYGHAEGDNVLRLVGRAILDFANESETPARIGGEEFMLICPNVGLVDAGKRAEALRLKIEAITGAAAAITASFGVAAVGEGDEAWQDTVHRADEAMYAAKKNGRNQVALWSTDLGSLKHSPKSA